MRPAEPFHTRLKRLRIDRRMTQKQLAEPRFTAAYMSILESGRRQPSPSAIAYLAERLGVDHDELASGRPRDLVPRLLQRLQEGRSALGRGARSEAASEAAAVREEASRHQLVRVEAKAVELIALVEERAGTRDRALELYEEVDTLLRDEPLPLRTEAIAGQARCLQMMGDLRYAIHILETHLTVLERSALSDPSALMRIHASLVRPYTEAGLHGKAAEAARAALELEASVEDPGRVASMHLDTARALLDQDETEDALRSLERAEELYRQLEWDAETAGAYLARGIAMTKREDFDRARQLMTRAVAMLERAGDEVTHARALNQLAAAERALGDKTAAGDHLSRAMALLDDSDVAELGLSHREMGLCHWTDDPEAAEKHLREAISLFRRAELPIDQAATHLHLGDLFGALGDERSAAESYRGGLQSCVAGR